MTNFWEGLTKEELECLKEHNKPFCKMCGTKENVNVELCDSCFETLNGYDPFFQCDNCGNDYKK